ncbi:MAG: 50S ribosomal protein L3 [Clostridia bacterium]|nr:50S ribosomal protein L3 [Clostridia bacterium]MBR4054271.1 50S ribosomal protein L3 [Clostridia bacterium]
MKKGIIGRKLGMTQIFDEKGKVIPVTVINAGPCTVIQKKTVEKDGYSAVQLGYSDLPERKATKPVKGHFEAHKVSFKKYLKEFRLDDAASMNEGDIVTADTFAEGEKVDITGITKGHGYSGVIKRWNAHRLRMTHGTGPVHRQVGSMGANSDPSRVFKNKHMAGQYGHEQVTMLNLEIVKIDADNNLIAVKGAVPGPKGGIVYVRNAVK